ncbi:hypothetical protein ACF0H5_001998 [Mactra antiquata]
MDEESSFSESISVKSAANLFGGQAIIRRLPTPGSKRKVPPPVPARKSSMASNRGMKNGNNSIESAPKNVDGPYDVTKEIGVLQERGRESFTNDNIDDDEDDVLDKPLASLSEINGISECETYDNIENEENMPSYQQFINGAMKNTKLFEDCESEVIKEIHNVPGEIENLIPNSTEEATGMDFTVLGTISPLNDKGNKNGNSKEEMSLVLGRPMSPVSSDYRLKRCLSPSYEPKSTTSAPDSTSTNKRVAGTRNRHIPVLSPKRESKQKEANHQVGIMCEGCNNCLLDLKRQALRLTYPDNKSSQPKQMVCTFVVYL